MQIWSQAATLAKNSLASDAPFLIFVEAICKELDEHIRLVRNTDDVNWRNETWTRFPINIDSSSEDGKTIPSLNLKISNCGGIVQQYLQQYNGLADSEVKIYVALASNLSSSDAEFELDFLIKQTKYDEQWITFVLGPSSELINRFPVGKYTADFCRFKIGDIRCGYTGAEKCVNNLKSCLIPERFGGEPGMTT